MSATTTDRQATRSGNTLLSLPVLANAVIPAGVMVAITAAGYATNAADTAALRVIGVSTESVDATDESSGALTIEVSRDVFRMENSADHALDLADVGQPCYVEDNQTVGTDPGSHSVLAGIVLEADANGVYVDFTSIPLPVLAGLAESGSTLDISSYRTLINPTGRFEIGGPKGDAGLTGRKIIVDTYGGMARHGGGAFSGKDPSKVDRSAAYATRWVAKNVVAAGLADRCEVQVAYAIGAAHPVGLYLETFGTNTAPVERIQAAIASVFDLRPAAIIDQLDLLRPIYAPTAAYGHFGVKGRSWEEIIKI